MTNAKAVPKQVKKASADARGVEPVPVPADQVTMPGAKKPTAKAASDTNKHHCWQATFNNVDATHTECVNAIKAYACVYGIMCFELAPTTGTPHAHVYWQFKSPKAMSTLQKAFDAWKPHLEATRGSHQSNIDYIKKDGQWEEWGEPKKQGQREDINAATAIIDAGGSLRDVARAYPDVYVKMHRGLKDYQHAMQDTQRTYRSAVIWLWGKAGTGKSYYVKNKHAGNLYIKEPAHKWWNGYTQQEAVLLDDFDASEGFFASKPGFRELLRLLDEGAFQVEYKGEMMEFNSRFIYITCEYPPSHFWEGNELKQIEDRIGEIRECKEKWSGARVTSAKEALRAAEELHKRRKFIGDMMGEEDKSDEVEIMSGGGGSSSSSSASSSAAATQPGWETTPLTPNDKDVVHPDHMAALTLASMGMQPRSGAGGGGGGAYAPGFNPPVWEGYDPMSLTPPGEDEEYDALMRDVDKATLGGGDRHVTTRSASVYYNCQRDVDEDDDIIDDDADDLGW